MLPNTVPPPVYCLFTDMQNVMSANGLNLRMDDNPPSAWRDSIYRAGSRINQYLIRRYDTVQLVGNYWVQFNAAIMATYILCGGRGNTVPQSLAKDYKEVIADLKEVRDGKADVPDVAARRQTCPVMSNTRILLAPQPHVRIDRVFSTKTGGDVTAYQQIRSLSELTDNWIYWPLG